MHGKKEQVRHCRDLKLTESLAKNSNPVYKVCDYKGEKPASATLRFHQVSMDFGIHKPGLQTLSLMQNTVKW